jgi:hypothetical protein
MGSNLQCSERAHVYRFARESGHSCAFNGGNTRELVLCSRHGLTLEPEQPSIRTQITAARRRQAPAPRVSLWNFRDVEHGLCGDALNSSVSGSTVCRCWPSCLGEADVMATPKGLEQV